MPKIFAFGLLALFLAAVGDGIYNDWQFERHCKTAGGIPVRYNTACVKPGSILFTSN